MLAALGNRLLGALVALLVASVLVFILVRLIPGDAATARLGVHSDPAQLAELRRAWGLDHPAPLQYLHWLGGIVRGDAGRSFQSGEPVSALIAETLPVTLELVLVTLLCALVIALPLGVHAARHRGRLADRLLSTGAIVGMSVPGFWLGTLGILVVSLWWGLLPAGGWTPPGEGLRAHLRCLILPVAALSAGLIAILARTVRAGMVLALAEPHLTTARAKGADTARVLWHHALRRGLQPVVVITGVQAGYLLAGTVVIEAVFALPGMGRLMLGAIGHRDQPVLLAAVLCTAACFVLCNCLADCAQLWLDPRQRRLAER